MAAYFFDSSALVKRYATETGTVWVKGLISPAAGNRIYVARITEVETIAALARKERGGHVMQPDLAIAVRTLESEMVNLFRIVEVTIGTFSEAKVIAQRHFLRGYDSVQLATALEANTERIGAGLVPLTMITADKELLVAAQAEGLFTDDPENH